MAIACVQVVAILELTKIAVNLVYLHCHRLILYPHRTHYVAQVTIQYLKEIACWARRAYSSQTARPTSHVPNAPVSLNSPTPFPTSHNHLPHSAPHQSLRKVRMS